MTQEIMDISKLAKSIGAMELALKISKRIDAETSVKYVHPALEEYLKELV